jgi:hypothetical protein
VIAPLLAAAALAAAAPAEPPHGPSLVAPDRPARPALALAVRDGRGGDAGAVGAAPACSGDTCQPIVAVPGFEPTYTIRGKRTELAMRLAARFPVEPFTSIFWWLAASGLRLEWTPPQLAPGSYPPGYGGFGFVGVELRWRIDALGAPVLPTR